MLVVSVVLNVFLVIAVLFLLRRNQRLEQAGLERIRIRANRRASKLLDQQQNLVRRFLNALTAVAGSRYQVSQDLNCGLGYAVFVRQGRLPVLAVYVNTSRSEGKQILVGLNGTTEEHGVDNATVEALISRLSQELRQQEVRS